jgi:hypothetical protein
MNDPDITFDELERVRSLFRRIQRWDRGRRWRAGVAALVAILGIVLIAMVADLWFRGFIPNAANAGNWLVAGFGLGVVIGLTVGFALHGLGSVMAFLLTDPFRDERLLVKYYESLLRQGSGARAVETFLRLER